MIGVCPRVSKNVQRILNIKKIHFFGKWLSLENDSNSHLENNMCEGVSVDSKYGIGWVTCLSMAFRHSSRDIHDSLECLLDCLVAIACALRWGVTQCRKITLLGFSQLVVGPPFRYRFSIGV